MRERRSLVRDRRSTAHDRRAGSLGTAPLDPCRRVSRVGRMEGALDELAALVASEGFKGPQHPPRVWDELTEYYIGVVPLIGVMEKEKDK